MNLSSPARQVFLAALLFVLLLLAVPRAGFPGDVDFWVRWAGHILANGLGNAYEVADNTYNPLYHYILWAYGKLAGSPEKISLYRHWIKAFVLVFDFAGAFWAASLVPERERRFGLVLLLLFNLGYLYNTLIWEQIDATYTFFAFGAVVLAVRGRGVGSALCYVLALAAKTQAIIFLPPLLLLWVPLWWHRPGQLLGAAAGAAALATLVLAPFVWFSWMNYLPHIIAFNLSVTTVFQQVSVNAYNLWYLLAPEAAATGGSDLEPFGGLTYHAWGLLLFGAAAAAALLPLLLEALARLRARRQPGAVPTPALAPTLLACGLVPLCFAFFNTQMHERYWHATLLFVAAYGFVRRDHWLFALVSIAYFLNLEAVLKFLGLPNYRTLIFDPRFVAGLFGLAIALGLAKLYAQTEWRGTWQRIRQGAGPGGAEVASLRVASD